MSDVPHYNVVIATPGRSMDSAYVSSLIETIKYLNENNITFTFTNQYSSQVHAAREATAMGSMFLDIFNNKIGSGKFTYDKIFWIDSDIAWNIGDFMRLYESDKDIVSGIYLNHMGTPMFSLLKEDENINDVIQSRSLTEIFAAGFGFICMNSGVFESLPRPWFDISFSKVVSETGEEALVPFGEDYSWCNKARDNGYSIFIDPVVKVSHYKTVQIDAKVLNEQ